MLQKIEGIVTAIVRHNDSHNVVTLYTRQRGRMAFLVPVGKSKSGRMRNASLSLLAVVGADVNFREGKELYNLRNIEPIRLWHGIYSHPVKSAILFFLAEFCNRLLRQYPADEVLWNQVLQSLLVLDAAPSARLANFPMAFLIGLLPIVGIEPPARGWDEGDRFDMLSGEMVGTGDPEFMRRRSFLSEEESRVIPLLSRMNFRNMQKFRFKGGERNRVLDRLLAYYSTHLPIGTDFNSLPVVRELFA